MVSWKKFLRQESGATAIEYGLIVALVAVVALSSMWMLNDSFRAMYDTIAEAMKKSSP